MATDALPIQEKLILAIGLSSLESSPPQLLAKLIGTLEQRERFSIVIVGVPPTQVSCLIDAGIGDASSLLQAGAHSMELHSGKIWFLPTGTVATTADTKFELDVASAEERFPIDQFFRTIAQDPAFQTIGLLLHGRDSDGVLGLRCISDNGGFALMEAPGEEFADNESGTIRRQMAGGDIDHYAGISRLGPIIDRYISHHFSVSDVDPTENARRSIIEALGEIADILHQQTNHQFKNYKTSTLVRRIERRIKVTQLGSIEDYLERLRNSEAERAALFRDLLISVTAFFRDPDYLQNLKDTALRRLVESQDQLRIWVAGCASGEEAFTMAMLCDELKRELSKKCEIQIFGTDIDTRALAVARRGEYPTGIESQLAQERLDQYFVKKAGRYQVAKSIREMCLFSVHNLISDPPFSKLDLITCRNVLIYLGTHLQVKLMPLFHFALNPNGYLFLGPSESLSGNRELFQEVDHKHRVYQRRKTAIDGRAGLGPSVGASPNPQQPAPQSSHDLKIVAQKIVLGEFSPEWVIIDESRQVVIASDEIQSFLRIGGGKFENNVINWARTGLKAGLRATINDALKKRRRVDHDQLSMRVKRGIQRVRLTVQPMPRMGNEGGLLMIVFRKEGAVVSRDEFESLVALNAGEALIQQLESDLARTREDLERSFQDLEAANEELKSSNEELLSMNEELQTANEELESSKEELNATNAQLLSTKNDLENLFQSSDVAMIFVDRNHHVKGFTDAAKNVYNLIDTDVGRPLWHLTHNALEMPELPRPEDLSEFDKVDVLIKTRDGRIYKRRVMPYVDRSLGSILGLVLSFTDETRSIKSEYRARFAIEAGRMGVWKWQIPASTIEFDEFARELFKLPVHPINGPSRVWPLEQALVNLAPLDREMLKRDASAAFAAAAEFSLDCQLILPEGGTRWLTIRGSVDQFEDHALTGVVVDTTEPKVFYDRVAASEAFNRAIVESSPDCVKVMHRDGRVLSMNASGCKLMQIDDFELIRNRPWWELWPKQQQTLIRSAVDASLRGELVHFQAECPTTRGEPRWWDVVLANIANEGGDVEQLIAVSRDITATKQNEQLTIEFAEKLRAAIEVAEIGIATVDYSTNTVVCDAVAARIMSLPASTAVTRKEFHDRFVASDRQRILEAADSSLRVDSDRGFFAEARVPNAAGLKWVNLRKRNYFNESGDVVRGMIAIQDITELRRTEHDLRNQHERLQHILTAAQAGTWDWDVAKGSIVWSKESRGLFGLEDEQEPLTFDSVMLRIHEEDRERVHHSLREAFVANDRQWRNEFRIVVAGNIRWLFSSGTIEYTAENEALRVAGIHLDISPLKAMEQELIAARDAAERASRVRGEFLANMSHEIRTPMTAILGHADILADQLREADDMQSLEAIRRNGRHLLDLINDILDLSKIDAGRLEISFDMVSPAELLADVRSLMDVRAVEKSISLKFRILTKVPEYIQTDELRLRQVLINLLGNAIKFTDHGSVTLDVRFEESGSMLYFRIEDTGIGIPHEMLPSLFDDFTQADSSHARRFEGTGLGLAISRRLVQALGGEIVAESKPGVGSVFTIVLPCVNAKRDCVQLVIQNPPDDYVRPVELAQIDAVVLIVDDRRDIRLIAQHMVEKAGGQVLTAENGQQAVDLLTGEGYVNVDLVLMDMQMPVLDGYAAVQKLRHRGFVKPIIALTANAMKEDRDRCLKAGCDDYTSKPLDNRKLIELIVRLLRRAN